MTVYAGSNTFSNIVQTPANCDGCSRDFGSIHEEDARGGPGLVLHARRARQVQHPGSRASSVILGRNYFRGPGGSMNCRLAKRTRTVGSHLLEFRADATNVPEQPDVRLPHSDAEQRRLRSHPQHGDRADPGSSCSA